MAASAVPRVQFGLNPQSFAPDVIVPTRTLKKLRGRTQPATDEWNKGTPLALQVLHCAATMNTTPIPSSLLPKTRVQSKKGRKEGQGKVIRSLPVFCIGGRIRSRAFSSVKQGVGSGSKSVPCMWGRSMIPIPGTCFARWALFDRSWASFVRWACCFCPCWYLSRPSCKQLNKKKMFGVRTYVYKCSRHVVVLLLFWL